MLYNFNGKSITIPDNEIKKNMVALDLSETDAIELWLDDNGYTTNEEQEELDKKAKQTAIKMGLHENKKAKGERKPRTCQVSDEKQLLFNSILSNLTLCESVTAENITILTQNKLIEVKIGDKKFKIDLIQCRK